MDGWISLVLLCVDNNLMLGQVLEEKDEILIGGVLRFSVGMEKSMVERDVPADQYDEGAESDDSHATAPDHAQVEMSHQEEVV